MALFQIKFQSIPSQILFTLTDDPQFYGLEVSLNYILMVGLFRSNRMVIFSKTEKKSFFLFSNKRSIVHFYRWRGLGPHNWSYNRSKYFKIITNSVIRRSSFFLVSVYLELMLWETDGKSRAFSMG